MVAAEKILKEDGKSGHYRNTGGYRRAQQGTGCVRTINPQTYEKDTLVYIDLFVELRKAKNDRGKARETILNDYAYYGCLIKKGDADGMVSGACHSTANTLRPCLQVIKTKPGTKLVSASSLWKFPTASSGTTEPLFADRSEPEPEPGRAGCHCSTPAEL